MEISQCQQENDDNEQEDETEKINFYLKLGKNKKFKFMWFILEKKWIT